VEAIEWVVDLLVSIYDWIVEAIKGIILNIKKLVGFVDDFPNIIGGFFDGRWDDLKWVIEKLT
jgi:hypothetical protein